MDNMANSFNHLLAMTRARIAPEIVRYARIKFPEITDELIERNLCEIMTAYDAEFKCKSCCVGIDMCPELINSAGYTYSMILQENGWIKIEYVHCMFNGGKEFATDKEIANFTQMEMVV